jgi:putative ABC transport system ATP-binding protein
MLFQAENLTKVYHSKRGTVTALNGISFSIEKGSFITITGSSGSGKSTLLLTMGGLIRPTSGMIRFGGSSLFDLTGAGLAQYRNSKVGFVLQTFNLVPYLTTLENVMLPMIFQTSASGGQEETAKKLLNRVGLIGRDGHLPRELSVGQQQRVAIARALANDPEIILADEPTGNLDPALSLEILELLKELNERESRTVIIVTHSPMAATFGTKRFQLEEGRLA